MVKSNKFNSGVIVCDNVDIIKLRNNKKVYSGSKCVLVGKMESTEKIFLFNKIKTEEYD